MDVFQAVFAELVGHEARGLLGVGRAAQPPAGHAQRPQIGGQLAVHHDLADELAVDQIGRRLMTAASENHQAQ